MNPLMNDTEKECMQFEIKLNEKILELKKDYNNMSIEAQKLFNQKYQPLLDLWAKIQLLMK